MNKRFDQAESWQDPDVSDLYQQLDKPNPSASLDEKIKSTARKPQRPQTWLPLSAAASVLMATGLAVLFVANQGQDTFNTLEEPELAPPLQAQEARAQFSDGAQIPRAEPAAPPAQISSKLRSLEGSAASSADLIQPEVAPLADDVGPVPGATDPYHDFTADDWLTQIQALWQNGDYAQARESYANFRRRYPDMNLPTDFPVSEAGLLLEP